MTAMPATPVPEVLETEWRELRASLLDSLLLITLLAPVAWLIYVMAQGYLSGWVDLAIYQFIPCVALVLVLRQRHLNRASWVLLLDVVIGQALVALAHPDPLVMTLGAPVIILAHVLLGGWQALLIAAFAWSLPVATLQMAALSLDRVDALQVLALYLLTWGASWLATQPLRRAIGWSTHGWDRAQQLLAEARERRRELYRALHALEEATYRIERMNHELVIARRQAEQARAFKARYATTVSHELRGPLSMILGFSRLMVLSPEKYGQPLPTPYLPDVDAIYRNAQHLSTLLDDILDLAQIEAERLPLIKDWLDVPEEVCRKAVEIVTPLAERKGLTIRLAVTPGLPQVMGDPVRLRQVLLNLLTNAIRFTERGAITVDCDRDGGSEALRIRVTDTGSGIAPEEMPRLFEEFHQVGGVGREGSGLGLTISKELIELHGGRMWAESQKGVGTSFFLTLPLPGTAPLPDTVSLSKGEEMAPFTSWSREPQPRERATRVCLALYLSPHVVRILARYLEGYRLVALSDDREAGVLVEAFHPTAILTPSERVEQVASRLAASSSAPIIGCDIPDATDSEGLDGVLGHVIKPLAPDVLASLMRQVAGDGELTILLADDEPDFVRLMEGMLMTLPRPYRILRAYDGVQALEQMQQAVPDLVFLDLVMPEMGGKDVVRQMRQDPRLRGVPVIIVSAQDPSDQTLALHFPLSVCNARPVGLGEACKGLLALLEMVSPDYLDPALP